MNEPLGKPSFIVDSDWKEQVEKEKAAASLNPAATEKDKTQAVEDLAPLPKGDDSESSAGSMPPPGFTYLVSMLFTQAMAFLGQIPDPIDNTTRIDKSMAKHTIDTLDSLQQKTSGNLSDDEKRMLTEALHVLRMTYVNCRPK